MTREHPTTEELDAIEQYQYGAYDVNLPNWYTTPEDAREALEDRHHKAPLTNLALTTIAAALLILGLCASAIGWGFQIWTR